MEAPIDLSRRPGGNVEPLDRPDIIKGRSSIPDLPLGPRYELRDPFAEVTYRSNSFDDMAAKADRLGAIRFVSVAPDGKRTPVAKDSHGWRRPEPQLAEVASRAMPIPTREANAPAAEPSPAAAALARIDTDAEREARIARIETSLNERYLIRRTPLRIGDVTIGQTEYRHRGDTSRIAFTESAFRLSTDSNNPSIARSMVEVAEARNWQALRVSGNEDFKRMVWLEASLRNVRTVGYDPVPGDQELLRKERDARQINRIEPTAPTGAKPETPAKQSARGGGSRKTVLAALEAVLVAKQVPEKQRQAVMTAAAENLSRRVRNGEVHRIKVYDKAAPSQRPEPLPQLVAERSRERAPTR